MCMCLCVLGREGGRWSEWGVVGEVCKAFYVRMFVLSLPVFQGRLGKLPCSFFSCSAGGDVTS